MTLITVGGYDPNSAVGDRAEVGGSMAGLRAARVLPGAFSDAVVLDYASHSPIVSRDTVLGLESKREVRFQVCSGNEWLFTEHSDSARDVTRTNWVGW